MKHWTCSKCQEGEHPDCRDKRMCWCATFHTPGGYLPAVPISVSPDGAKRGSADSTV